LTEFAGRLLPNRFKLSLQGRINPSPIRYGVLLGMMFSPFLGGYVCCTYCNFTMMQNLVSAATGDLTGFTAWASFTIITFVLWFFVLGIFFQGGRGFCNFLCPAGAVQGLFHTWGKRLGISRAIHIDPLRCKACNACVAACPALAISADRRVNYHACNLCRDCMDVCKNKAVEYGRYSADKASFDR
jgi:ferredoxin-type protein NapH